MSEPTSPAVAPRGAPDRDIVDRLEGRRERVHIAIGPTCNNNCIFCMEEDREGRKVINGALTPERVRKILEAYPGGEEVCFTSGEPTLVPALGRYARWAKRLGYRRVSVMTNGRRLAHMAFAEHLVKAGINHFYVSIHGHTPKMHNSLVRAPGAYAQTVRGIENVAALKARWPAVQLHTSTVVTKRNYQSFFEIYVFLRALGVDQVVFNVMQANGRANTHFERIFPRYTDIAAQFRGFLDRLGDPARSPELPARLEGDRQQAQAFLVDIPLCTTTQLPDFNRGYVERYVHHEVKDDAAGPHPLPGVDGRPSGVDDTEFVAVTREDLDLAQRVHRPACEACRYRHACEGVWRNYLRRFGWDEFQPVPAPGADATAPGAAAHEAGAPQAPPAAGRS